MFVSGYRCVAFDVRKTVQSQTGILVWLQVCGVRKTVQTQGSILVWLQVCGVCQWLQVCGV